jgi:S1-C subfamily serine protease
VRFKHGCAASCTRPDSSAIVSIGVLALDPPGSATPVTAGKQYFATLNGTGFVVSRDGHVLTALHVVRAAERAIQEMSGTDNRLFIGIPRNGTFSPQEAKLVDIDEDHDLALLQAKHPLPRTALKFASAPRQPEPW